MRRAAGQALRLAAGRLHWLVQVVASVAVLLLAAVAALAWRLDQGPLPLPFVAHRVEALARGRGVALSVAEASLAWAGFSRGLGAPVRLAFSGLRVTGADAAASPLLAASLAAEFSLPALLAGRFVPHGITLDGLRLTLTRGVAGRLALGTQPAPGPNLNGFGSQAAGGHARRPDWTALRHLHVHDVAVALYDAPLGLSWQVSRADADLDRDARGRLGGRAMIAVQAGAQRATLRLKAQQGAAGSTIEASLTPLDPAALAGLSPGFAALAGLDAPVALTVSAQTDAGFGLLHAHLAAEIGAGTVHAGRGSAPLRSATLGVDATPTTLDATERLETAPAPDGPVSLLTGTLHATRTAAGWTATEVAALDRVAFADLPALWPEGTGGPGTRPWLTKNIPSGELSGGRLSLTLAIPADFSDARLTAIDGAIDGHDLTVHWLRPVPPIEHASGRLTITDPDVIDIAIDTARQARPAASAPPVDGIAFSAGRVHLTGIAGNDQFADISTHMTGGLPDLLAVLKNKKVRLLDKRPIPMRDPAGRFAAELSVSHLPLRDDVSMDDLKIATRAQLSGVHLGGIAGGRDLDHGDVKLTADNDGLRVSGTAALAGIASQLDVAMDFRAGPPSQVQQRVTVRAAVDAAQLAGLGLPTRGILGGSVALDATLRARRDGAADIAAEANLTAASLDAHQLAWSKPRGEPVTGRLHVSLDHDRLSAIDDIQMHGAGVDIEGAADFADGQPQLFRLNRLVLAPDTDASGSVRLPRSAGEPYVVKLAGASLDASGVLKHSAAGRPTPRPTSDAAGPAWVVDARLGRVVLGPGRRVEDFSAHAENDGRVVRTALVRGVAQSVAPAGAKQRPAPFRLQVAPERGGRWLTASAPDAGGLLRVLDIAGDISGGRMEVAAHYDDARPGHPLAGTATLHDFRVLNAPVIGRVLQAATLYGLVEVLRGPGLGFSTMVAPFRWQDDLLSLEGARAYSASLGFTAKGDVDLAASRMDVQGTIVPAYFFNTLPGRIPLVGKLFSPERGGGLFAATYSVRGSFDDPKVGVNPLATLTPGFLRGVFGMFGAGSKAPR